VAAPVGPVTWAPEHRKPHDRDECELREDHRDLSEIRELFQDPLHPTSPSLPLNQPTRLWPPSDVRLGVTLASVLQPLGAEVRS
jgi:hypothetical protein